MRLAEMVKGDLLGKFEQLCLLAVIPLGANAYGVTILDEIEKRTGRVPNIGSIYATLDRMEEKGFVSSRQGEATGFRALDRMRRMQDSMWDGAELEPGMATGGAF